MLKESKIYKILLSLFRILILLYIGLLIFIGHIETNMTFPVTRYEKMAVSGEKISLNTNGDFVVSGVFRDNKAKNTVIYFHGNGGSINMFSDEIDYISSLGVNVLSLDFPGYGESTGKPTEENVYMMTQSGYDYLIKTRNIDPKSIIIWGYSIGSAAAVDLAYHNPASKLILVAPLTSRYDMSTALFGFPLQKYLFRSDSFVSIDKIGKIVIPTLIVHGTSDSVIPFTMGKQLFEKSASATKKFIPIDGADHNGIIAIYGDRLHNTLKEFIDKQ